MAPGLAGNCRGAYLLAMFVGTAKPTGATGTKGGEGISEVNGGVEQPPCEVIKELGEGGPDK